MTRIVLIDCDFCGARGVPWGGVIVGSMAETRWHYCERCCKPGRAFGDCHSLAAAERLRLSCRLAVALHLRGLTGSGNLDELEAEHA